MDDQAIMNTVLNSTMYERVGECRPTIRTPSDPMKFCVLHKCEVAAGAFIEGLLGMPHGLLSLATPLLYSTTSSSNNYSDLAYREQAQLVRFAC
jgi:hypothetical protein